MPPLSKYFESLLSEDIHVNETRALATVLNEELEELATDIQDGKERQSGGVAGTGYSTANSSLESRLINMLKQEPGLYLRYCPVIGGSRDEQVQDLAPLLRSSFWTSLICCKSCDTRQLGIARHMSALKI